jgi:hypothetical protein
MKKTIFLFLACQILIASAQKSTHSLSLYNLGDSLYDIVKKEKKVIMELDDLDRIYAKIDLTDKKAIRYIIYYFDEDYKCGQITILKTDLEEIQQDLKEITKGSTKLNEAFWINKKGIISTIKEPADTDGSPTFYLINYISHQHRFKLNQKHSLKN